MREIVLRWNWLDTQVQLPDSLRFFFKGADAVFMTKEKCEIWLSRPVLLSLFRLDYGFLMRVLADH